LERFLVLIKNEIAVVDIASYLRAPCISSIVRLDEGQFRNGILLCNL